MTSSNLVYLIALPLFSSALLMLLGRKADKWGHIFATLISASTFIVGAMEFLAMRDRPEESRAVTQKLFTWISVGFFNVDAGLLLDQLSIAEVLHRRGDVQETKSYALEGLPQIDEEGKK